MDRRERRMRRIEGENRRLRTLVGYKGKYQGGATTGKCIGSLASSLMRGLKEKGNHTAQVLRK